MCVVTGEKPDPGIHRPFFYNQKHCFISVIHHDFSYLYENHFAFMTCFGSPLKKLGDIYRTETISRLVDQ